MRAHLFREDLLVNFSAISRIDAIAQIHRKLDVERSALLRNIGGTRLLRRFDKHVADDAVIPGQ